jgi:predicted RNase H-like nuclease (RuvC/YqgF family)
VIVTEPRIIRGRDAERAVADLAREHEVLAGMTGADSRRIDALVGDVGQIKGQVQSVKEKVEGVADGVNELRDALTVLVKHDMKMQHTDGEVVSLRRDVLDISGRVHELERQMGPVVETRAWAIRGILAAVALVGIAIAKLVIVQ